MRLHSPAFEKTLRRAVKQAVRSEPAQRKEYRRVRRYARRSLGTRWPFRIWITVVLAVIAGGMTARATLHLDAGVAVTGWAGTLWLLALAQSWLGLPGRSGDAVALRFLPVSDPTIFAWERDKLLRLSLFALLDVAACLGVIGAMLHFSAAGWLLVAPVALLSWAFFVAGSAAAAAWLPGLPYGAMALWLFISGVGLALFGNFEKNSLPALLDHVAPTAGVLLPAGWPLGLMHLTQSPPEWSRVLLLVPVIAVLVVWRDAVRILEARFVYHEPTLPHVADIVPGEEHAEAVGEEGAPRPIGVTAIAEGVMSGDFLALEEWRAGWMDRLLWRWLTPRERILAEFAFPRPPNLTRAWYQIARNFLIALPLGLLATKVSVLWRPWFSASAC